MTAPPALLFDNLDGGMPGARVLTNMLGASAARYVSLRWVWTKPFRRAV